MGWNEKNHKLVQKMKQFQSLVEQRGGMGPSLLANVGYCCTVVTVHANSLIVPLRSPLKNSQSDGLELQPVDVLRGFWVWPLSHRWRFCQLAPHPVRDTSVKKNRLVSGRCKGTPLRTSRLLNQWSCVRNFASSWIGVSQDCLYSGKCHFIQNCRNLRCRRPWWIKGAKCDIRLVMEDIFRAGMTLDVDRQIWHWLENLRMSPEERLWLVRDWNVVPRSLECVRVLA